MILLTFLGNSNYLETEYRWKDQSVKTAFSAAACTKFLCPDEVVIFLTAEARGKNLGPLAEKFSLMNTVFRTVDVPVGKTEEELWGIFSLLNDSVPDNSEVAFDVTTGQRSSPLLGLMASMFMKTARDVKIRHMLYGAFDVDKTAAPGVTPVFDLSPMLTLLDWSIAAEKFNRSGDSADMAGLLLGYGDLIGKSAAGKKTEYQRARVFRQMGHQLQTVTDSLYLLRPNEAMENIAELEDSIDNSTQEMEKSPQAKPFGLLLSRIREAYLPLSEETPEDQSKLLDTLRKERDMISWYRDRDLWIQAVSLAREWLLSWVMVRVGIQTVLDRTLREKVNFEIDGICKKSFRSSGDNVEEVITQPIITVGRLAGFSDLKEFSDLWTELVDLRNDINHAAKRDGSRSAAVLKERIEICVQRINRLPMPDSKKECTG